MDITPNLSKRKHPTDRSPPPPSKRHRHASPDGSRSEEEDDHDDLEFLNHPGAKEELVDELELLAIPKGFDAAAKDAESYLPVCPAHEHIQHILDIYEEEGNTDDVSDGGHVDQLSHSSVFSTDYASYPKEQHQEQRQHPLPTQRTPRDTPIEPPAASRGRAHSSQEGGPPWKRFVPYKPLFWPVPDLDKAVAIKKTSTLEGLRAEDDEERNLLDLSEDLQLGSLWTRIREYVMTDLLTNPLFVPRSHQVECNDFLKACVRLRHMVHPDRLSALLGATSRPPQYCEFLLRAMLGFFNMPDIRRRIDPRNRVFKSHVHIDVYHDAMYPDNDPIIRRLDRLQKRDEAAKGSKHEVPAACGRDTYQDELILLSNDPIYRESDQEETETPNLVSQRLQYEDPLMEEFAEYASYVLRSYMYNISGVTFYNLNDFAKHCQQLDISFFDAPRADVNHKDGDLKWINEPALAATIGKRTTIKEPLQLWQHAMDNFSMQNLARCALIRTDSLLDWLEFVGSLNNPKRKAEEYFMYIRPVVCLAPVALLHLSDIAANFALDVLRVAVEMAESDYKNEADEEEEIALERASDILPQDTGDQSQTDKAQKNENGNEHMEIGLDDIRKAARWKLRNTVLESATGMNNLHQGVMNGDQKFVDFLRTESQWPRRKVRPYTSAETFTLCSRFPSAMITIPHSAICEKRAIVMGLSCLRQNDAYTAGTPAIWPRRKIFAAHQRSKSSGIPLNEPRSSAVEHPVTGESGSGTSVDTDAIMTTAEEDHSKAIQENRIVTHNASQILTTRQTVRVDKSNDNPSLSQEVDNGHEQTRVSGEHKSQQQGSGNNSTLHEKDSSMKIGSLPDQDMQGSAVAYQTNLAERRLETMKNKYVEFFSDTKETEKLKADFANKKIRLEDPNKPSISNGEDATDDPQNEERILTGIADDDYLRHSSSSLCYNRLHWIVLHALGINIGQRTTVYKPLTYASATNYTNFGHFTSTKSLSIDREGLFELANLTELIVRDEAEILMACAMHDDGRPWIDRADVALVHAVRKKEFPYNYV